MKGEYIIAHDVGTSGNKAVLTDLKGHIRYSALQSYDVFKPEPLGVEQDPTVLYSSIITTTKELLIQSDISPQQVFGIGISTQAFNLLPLDKRGNPTMDMISWMDLRCVNQAERLKKRIDTNQLLQLTSNFPHAKDVIPKILWLKEERPAIWKKTQYLANCKEYIINKLVGKLAMDPHSASIFFLLDPITRVWSKQACEILDIPIEKLPPLLPETEVIGGLLPEVADQMGLLEGTPVVLSPADIAAAQVGCGAGKSKHASLSLGTGGWICVSSSQLVNNPEYPFWAMTHIEPDSWIIGGGLDTGGGGMRWFRDTFCDEQIKTANQMGIPVFELLSQMAQNEKPGSGGLIFIPWVYGERGHLGIDHYAKGSFIGLDNDHSVSRMARSIMEGVAFHLRWMIEELEEIGLDLNVINMIGGGSTSSIWLEIISDIFGREIFIPIDPQSAGSIGTALTVAVGLGVYQNIQDAYGLLNPSRSIKPTDDSRRSLYDAFFQEYKHLSKSIIPSFKRLYEFGKRVENMQ